MTRSIRACKREAGNSVPTSTAMSNISRGRCGKHGKASSAIPRRKFYSEAFWSWIPMAIWSQPKSRWIFFGPMWPPPIWPTSLARLFFDGVCCIKPRPGSTPASGRSAMPPGWWPDFVKRFPQNGWMDSTPSSPSAPKTRACKKREWRKQKNSAEGCQHGFVGVARYGGGVIAWRN